MQEEINLWDLWKIFKKHAALIIGLTILGAALSVGFMKFFVTPMYSSAAQLLVNEQKSNEAAIQLGDVQTSVQLINTYRDIIRGDSVLNQVNENMGDAYSIPQLRDAISIQQSQNSQAFNLSVTMESPEEAQNILNNITIVFEETVREFYGNENTNIFVLSPASYNPNPVSPSLPLYIIIGAFLGFALSLLIVFIMEISDTTVKDEAFLTSLSLVNLGQINVLTNKELKNTRLSRKNN